MRQSKVEGKKHPPHFWWKQDTNWLENNGFQVFFFGRCSPFFAEDESKFMRISQHSFQICG